MPAVSPSRGIGTPSAVVDRAPYVASCACKEILSEHDGGIGRHGSQCLRDGMCVPASGAHRPDTFGPTAGSQTLLPGREVAPGLRA